MNLPTNQEIETPAHLPGTEEQRPLLAKVAVGLALLTFLIFLPVAEYEFTNYDDNVFVTDNVMVAPGFTWEGVKWAFTSADIDYWRPLSWLSHMLDIELFGAVGGLHHLTNLVIHIAGVLMAFLAFNRLTGALWPSAMVAALFAWHPLHVESVAWIAERKDVLCGFFFFLTLWAYGGYASGSFQKWRWYGLAVFSFACGAASKPMIVTLPCVLLLLDYWPLRRISPAYEKCATRADRSASVRIAFHLVAEKLPFFAIVALLSASTILAQHKVGAMSDLDRLSLAFRIHNALNAYAIYLGQLFWPKDLSILYPYSLVSVWKWASAGLLLAIVSLICWRLRSRQPYLLVGWLWFLGTLVPVIGLLQVGEQAHANRYTYIPLVGPFLMLVWWVRGWAADRHQAIARGLAIGWLAGLALVSRVELLHWETSLSVFQRAVDVTRDNHTALSNLGVDLFIRGRVKEAIQRQNESIAIHPTDVAYLNLFLAYHQLGKDDLALAALNRAFRLNPKGHHGTNMLKTLQQAANRLPDRAMALKAIALAHSARGDLPEAGRHLELAVKERPNDPMLRIDLAANLSARARDADAIQHLRLALDLQPTNAIALSNLGALLAKSGNLAGAMEQYQEALRHAPNNLHTRYNTALVLTRLGRLTEARQAYEAVLTKEPRYLPAARQLAWLLATDKSLRDGTAAVKVAAAALAAAGGVSTSSLDDITAAAHAAAGNFTLAVSVGTTAQAGAEKAGLSVYASKIKDRVESYRRGQPYDRTPGEVAPQ